MCSCSADILDRLSHDIDSVKRSGHVTSGGQTDRSGGPPGTRLQKKVALALLHLLNAG